MLENLTNVSGGRPTPLRPILARTLKKVQFPTLQELDKNLAPPGSTPISSYTNLTETATTFTEPPTPIKAKNTKLIHSSTSLEVELDDVPSLSSISSNKGGTTTTGGNATTPSSACLLDRKNGNYQLEQPVYKPPRFSPSKRGSSVPTKRTVSTEPAETTSSVGPKTPTIPSSTPRNTTVSSRRSSILPTKSILRKPLVTIKDTNSNIINNRSVESNGSLASSLAESVHSTDDADGTEAIKNEMWESIGKTSIPLAAEPSRRILSRRGRECRTPRSRSTLSSSGTFYSEYELSSSGRKSISTDDLPPMMTESRGGRSVTKHLTNLTSVLSELRQREVVFDRTTAIQALKARILRGEKVTHEEIKAIRNMTLPPHQRHLGYRLPWSTDLYCVKGLVHIPTPNKPPTGKNTFSTMEDLRIPYSDELTMEHYGRRHYVVNLAGFDDEHISLYLEGKNRLVLRAERADTLEGEEVPMAVTETILLPPDLPADNLRIARSRSGTTIIEESWRF